MKKFILICLCLLFAAICFAQTPIIVKVASVAPSRSPWEIEQKNLSLEWSKITNGKYSNVKYNDELGLVTELDNGNYVLADRLSIGTIDQLYLALRLSIIKELSEETIPIFLDESFAYYDDERLKNILKFIYDEFKNFQIIIFTCTNREKDLFDKLNINYNLINI